MKLDGWKKHLANHHDALFKQTIFDIIRYGVKIGYTGTLSDERWQLLRRETDFHRRKYDSSGDEYQMHTSYISSPAKTGYTTHPFAFNALHLHLFEQHRKRAIQFWGLEVFPPLTPGGSSI